MEQLWPSRPPRPGNVREWEAEAMRELRACSREGREHELGEKLLALALRWAVSFEDMVTATERSPEEVWNIIQTFRQHDELCKASAAADRVRRRSPAFG
jgi:hypothetical protein